jgi:hypothetical protein
MILHLYDHLCVAVGGKAVILDAINARALNVPEPQRAVSFSAEVSLPLVRQELEAVLR